MAAIHGLTPQEAHDSSFGHIEFIDPVGSAVRFPNYDHLQWWIEDMTGVLQPLHLHSAGGYCVTAYDLGFPEVRDVEEDRPLAHGTFDATQYAGNRVVSLEITLLSEMAGISDAQLRSRLAAFMHPSRRFVLSFSEHDWPIRRRVVGRGHDFDAKISTPTLNEMDVDIVVPSGVIEGYAPKSIEAPLSVALNPSPIHVDLYNDGDLPANWEFIISNLQLDLDASGDAAGAGLELSITRPGFTWIPTETPLRIMLDLADTDQLHLYSADKSAFVTGPTGSRATVYQQVENTDWWMIPPGFSQFHVYVIDAFGNRIDVVPEGRTGQWTNGVGNATPPVSPTVPAAAKNMGMWQPNQPDRNLTSETLAAGATRGDMATLATLKASTTVGDGVGVEMLYPDNYVTLDDDTFAHYDDPPGEWVAYVGRLTNRTVWALPSTTGGPGGDTTEIASSGMIRFFDTWTA